jgi:subtilisin family serine protease
MVSLAAPTPDYAPGEILIGYKRTSASTAQADALVSVGAKRLQTLRSVNDRINGDPGIDHVKVNLPLSVAIEALKRHPAVAFAEPNYILRHTATANDTYYTNGSLWGTYGDDALQCGPAGTTNVYGSDAEEAWFQGYTGSKDVYVGVIDEGMQVSHPDLNANIWVNPFDPVDGVDNDFNGYIDDVNGWDFFNRDSSVYDGGTGDAHGTHVAGLIGARAGNGAGIAGINWDVTIISTKFLGPNGGYTSDAVSAINYLRDLKTRYGLKIVASNNSWGGDGYSSALHTAIIRAAKQDILFIAAAGNNNTNNDATANYPSNYSTLQGTSVESAASYEAVIAVAALTSSGAKASYSSYGATAVDLGAPGSSIVSTVPIDSYASYSGTSMATPHVTGAVALYASAFPSATAAQIRSAVLSNVLPTASMAGITVTGGRLNLQGLFGGSPPPPVDPIHDVAVTSISAPGTAKLGKSISVSISFANQGNQPETFAVSLAASGGAPGAPRTVTLNPDFSATVSISWRPPSVRGTYTLIGSAAVVSGETDTADNSRSTTVSAR